MASNTAAQHFDFLRGLIAHPKNVAAITPSSPALARAVAEQIDPSVPGPVLELGPGTGVVTEALIEHGIAPERLTAIEFDPDFASLMRDRFPRVRVIEDDAFDLSLAGDAAYAGIVSGLPLLNHPTARRRALIEDALARLKPGAPYVQFSYGTRPAIPAPEGATVERAAVVWFNLPPARVWVYRRG